MAEIPSTSSADYSRDGKRIAFLSNRSGTPQVWVVDAAGGEPKQVTQSSDPVGSVEWSPVEDRIAYDVARGGGYNAQVYYSKPDGTDAKRITSGGKEDNFSGSFAPDGRYYFRSAQRDPQSPDSWIYDPKAGKASIAIQYDGFGGINDIERPANRALINRLVTRGNNNLYLHDLQTHAGDPAHAARRTGARVRRARRLMAARCTSSTTLGAIVTVVSRTPIDAAGKPGAMTLFAERNDAEADSFTISEDGRRAVLAWNVGGRTELELVSLPDGKRTPFARAPGEVVSVSDFSPDGSRVALNVTGAALPSSAWQYEFASQRYTQIAPVAMPGVELVDAGAA